MLPFILSPKKAKESELRDIIQCFSTKLDDIYEKEDYKLSFLSGNRFLEIWRNNLLQTISTFHILRAAIASKGRAHFEYEDSILGELPGQGGFQYVPAVLSAVPSIPANQESMAREIAITLWDSFYKQNYFDHRNRFARCCKVFPKLFQNANAFLESSMTQSVGFPISEQDEWLWKDTIFVSRMLMAEPFKVKPALKRAETLHARQQRNA